MCDIVSGLQHLAHLTMTANGPTLILSPPPPAELETPAPPLSSTASPTAKPAPPNATPALKTPSSTSPQTPAPARPPTTQTPRTSPHTPAEKPTSPSKTHPLHSPRSTPQRCRLTLAYVSSAKMIARFIAPPPPCQTHLCSFVSICGQFPSSLILNSEFSNESMPR